MPSLIFVLENRENFPIDVSLFKNYPSILSMTNHKDEIFLPDANIKTMEKLVDFLEISEKDFENIPVKPQNFETVMNDGYSNYWFKKLDLSTDDKETLFKLINTSNFLGITDLLNICCKCIASFISGKDPHEIRKEFGITNDFTPEEEAIILKENSWIDEIGNYEKDTADIFKDIPCEPFENIGTGNDIDQN